MEKFLQELGVEQENFVLFHDSLSVAHLGKNLRFHSKLKHNEVRCHLKQDSLETNTFSLKKIHSEENDSDMMTKTLLSTKRIRCFKNVRMVEHLLLI